MKTSEIRNKAPEFDITINSNEARLILIDLKVIERIKEPMPQTKRLILDLEKLVQFEK